MIISIYKDIYTTKDVPYKVDVKTIIQRIRDGASKQKIIAIRQEQDKEKRNELKKSLPAILFSGEFKQRNSDGLIKHSGLMCLDFDGFTSVEEMEDYRAIVQKNKYVYLCFISPSGNGLKAVIKVKDDLTKVTHPKVFSQFQKEFNYNYFDLHNSNVDRVCYESYDPNIFVNENAEIYNPNIIDEGFIFSKKAPIIPINEEFQIIEKIMKFDWSKSYSEGQRNNYIFDLAGMFCEFGVNQSSAERYILSNIVEARFESEAVIAIKSAYRKRDFGTRYFENWNKIDSIKLDLKYGKKKVIEKHSINEEVYNEIKESLDSDDFWVIDEEKIKIIPLKYKIFLETVGGFKKYFPVGSDDPTFVQVDSNIVQVTSTSKIKDYVLKYLENRKEFEVWNYCSKFNNLFSEAFLLFLDTIELKILKDEKDKSFIAYQNGILEISKDSLELKKYIDVDGYIWQDQIIKRDFISSKNLDNPFKKFINNISNNNSEPLESVIGYMLSTYKNKANNKAVILNDEVISDNPEGGTGKGVFVQGLSQIRKVSILDGKTFDEKKSFPYQTVGQDTNILVFDDVVKNFNFESKFSLVTEGITLERKNKDAVKLSVEDSPKVLISTNYAIKGEGNSHDRRRHEVEVAQYYNSQRTPYDEFGHQLFDEWNKEQFIAFDNYMANCIQIYINYGLLTQDAKNIKMRKYIAETAMEFDEWMRDGNFPTNVRLDKKEKYNEFISDYVDFKKFLSQKKFTQWVQKYAKFNGFEYREERTMNIRFFGVFDGKEEVKNDEMPF